MFMTCILLLTTPICSHLVTKSTVGTADAMDGVRHHPHRGEQDPPRIYERPPPKFQARRRRTTTGDVYEDDDDLEEYADEHLGVQGG
eukprot:586191-Amphidinium_carterae.1